MLRDRQQELRVSDEAEAAIVADLFGDSPSQTPGSVLDASVSQATTLDLLDRIRRPEGDAEKITGIGPLVEAYDRGELSRADFHSVAKQLANAGTTEGATLPRRRRELVDFI